MQEQDLQNIRWLLQQINLDYPGLEAVRSAWINQHWEEAGLALVEYYRPKPITHYFPSGVFDRTVEYSNGLEGLLTNEFVYQGITARNPTLATGGLDWHYRGPRNDIEWTFYLNRHYFIFDAAAYYLKTPDSRLLDLMVRNLADWMANFSCPAQVEDTPQWRVLETARRVGGTWPVAFYFLQDHPAFTPGLRWTMLASIVKHGRYLKANHTSHCNHAVMEMTSLAYAAMIWPEFKESADWFDDAVQNLMRILSAAFYLDGVHKELSAHYHKLVLLNIIYSCRSAGTTTVNFPRFLLPRSIGRPNTWPHPFFPAATPCRTTTGTRNMNESLSGKSPLIWTAKTSFI
jgi:hypothetical protein